jgi:acetyltransferase-like isoleucine patch superfamily enzyme/acyl carrier protein
MFPRKKIDIERHTPAPEPVAHEKLDDSNFIRNKLFGSDKSAFARYRELVFHSYSLPKLIRYELLVTFIGPIPGALGLALRKRLYRSLFHKVGKGVIFGRNLTLNHADRITLGDNVVLDRDSVYDARGAGEAGIVIGNRVIVNRGAAIQAKVGSIEIGDDCNIGSDVDVIAQGPIVLEPNVSIACKAIVAGGRYVVEHETGDRDVKQRFTSGPIRIGRNARIGMGAIVQDGVTIGANAIIAPGAVVYENVPAEAVMWGNPARPVRSRTATPGVQMTRPAAVHSRPDTSALQQEVCRYLEEDLFVEFGPDGLSTSESLLAAGVMDSLALVRLLLWSEERFGVKLDFASLDPAEIDSVEKVVARIAAHTQ